jgi:undecaprenyl-diphosphatase
MSRPFFSARAGRLSLWLGGASLALLIFVRLTRELIEGDVDAVDNAILLAVAKTRTPWLTVTAVDLTALGSITLVVLFSAFTLLVLLVLRDRMGALQLLAASAGAGILTLATKTFVERVRPAEAEQLIVVSGFSYPSGHSVSTSALYLTIAIIASRYVQHAGARAAIFLAVSVVFILVAASRVYLGVHYPTDVISGISLGAAWALLIAGLFTRLGHRDSS